MGTHDDFSAIDELFAAFHAKSTQPGLAYGVVADGQLVHSGGFGELTLGGSSPTADSVFRIASMTKSFTAACLLGLRDEGGLSLDDPVHRWVPELAGLRGPTGDSPTITLRDLLTMSAGLPTDDAWGDRLLPLSPSGFDEILRRGFSFAWAPGTRFEYSNLSYAILGRVIAAATGLDYRDAVESRILRPLRLDSTVFEADEVQGAELASGHRDLDGTWLELPFAAYGEFAAMGGLFSSVRDVTRWVSEFTDAFPPRDDVEDRHILSRATRREMQNVHSTAPPASSFPDADGAPLALVGDYGFGLFVEHDPRFGPIVGHPGGLPGFGSAMRWHLDSGLGVVVVANATYAPAPKMAARALDAILASSRVPADIAPWPETEAARANVLRLLEYWDSELAARIFAVNVDMDESLARRRTEIERLCEQLGGLRLDPDGGLQVESPASVAWFMRGERGRAKVKIGLTPERPPAIQTFELTVMPGPAGPS